MVSDFPGSNCYLDSAFTSGVLASVQLGRPTEIWLSKNIRPKSRHISGGGVRGMPPRKIFKIWFSKNGISCILRTLFSKGLKSHLAIHILTQIYFFIKIKAAAGKQAIRIQTIASNAIVKIF